MPRICRALQKRMAVAGLLAYAAIAGSARAAETDDYAPPAVIQKRAYLPKHEFRLAFAYLPQDPFWKGVGPDLSYTWHPNEYWSWEVLRGAVFTTYDSDLRNKLRSQFDAKNDPYEKASYILASHVQFTPFYGRYSLLNRLVVHQESYATAGLSANGWSAAEGQPANGASKPNGGLRPGFDFGIGFRWYTSHKTSVKLEALENFFMRENGTAGDQFWLTLGVSFSVPHK
jgi:outer membrane beta-barrel protein